MLVEDYMRQMQERQVEDSFELLTTREREVLQLLAEGKSNKEVADGSYFESVHGGNAPGQHSSETQPAQRARS